MTPKAENDLVESYLKMHLFREHPLKASEYLIACRQQIISNPLDKALTYLAQQDASIDALYAEMELPQGYNASVNHISHKEILEIRLLATGNVFINTQKEPIQFTMSKLANSAT